MKRIAGLAALTIATVLVVANLLLIRPNDLVEFFVGFALGSLAWFQVGLGVIALALGGLSAFIHRDPSPWVRTWRRSALVVLALVAVGVVWRDSFRYSREEARFDAGGTTLGATVYRPRGDDVLRPAVIIVHGSGDRPRGAYHFMARRFAERGFIVLNADKAGIGESGGRYYGDDLGRDSVIQKRAGDTRAALRFLASLPGVDTARIGLVSISQGGWVIASLLDGSSPARYAINLSGPAVSSGEEGAWSDWTEEEKDHFGLKPPPVPFEELDRRMRTVPASAYDPRGALRQMTQPSLWLYGQWDSSLPVRSSIAVLDSLAAEGKPLTWRLFPEANHGLFVVRGPNGRRFARYAPGVWDTVFAWAERQRVVRR